MFNNSMNAHFPILGITGGIAAGKSTVSAVLKEMGWAVIDADSVARDVVAKGTDGLDSLARTFGADVLDGEGGLNRAYLAKIVFPNPELRRKLEGLLHPLIEAEIEKRIGNLPPSTKGAALEAALWIEIGKGHTFEELWVVDAPAELRLQRIMGRDGLGRAEAEERLLSQSSSAEKALHADLLIIADGRDIKTQIASREAALMANWKMRRESRRSHHMTCPFTVEELQSILSALLAKGGSYAEVFIEKRTACGLGMDDGRMEDVLSTELFGVGLRLMDGETTRFADLIAPSVSELIAAASELASPGEGAPVSCPPLKTMEYSNPCPIVIDPAKVPISQKAQIVRDAEALARSYSESMRPGSLRQVAVGYSDNTQCVWNAFAEKVAEKEDGEGESWRARLASDYRVQGVLRASITAGAGDQLETGFRALGEARGFELFAKDAVDNTVKDAVRQAIQALDAKPALAGTFPVVLSSSAGGTMIHEACGHGLEADLALAGMSAFANKMGQQVAAKSVTIIDDGTLPNKRGSQSIDDEGIPVQRVVLIENGVLKNYLQSRKTARRMGAAPTGNGRRESYRFEPIPRMRNTFLAPGGENADDILRGLKKGLFVKRMGGGQVDTVTGNFVFQVVEGYWVEDGQISHQVKNATLAGCGPEVLKQLEKIGDDLKHFDIGTCGKDGQGAPVSDAQPTILCPALVVGGTAHAPDLSA
ncbi:MAG: dephospho-CoA kinase [Holophagales bacterium]|jgi:TldD protein|nr:dephospho-CoA kinase [Holophagales bacterium]